MHILLVNNIKCPCLMYCFSTQSFCIFLTVVHDVKKFWLRLCIIYCVFTGGSPKHLSLGTPSPRQSHPKA